MSVCDLVDLLSIELGVVLVGVLVFRFSIIMLCSVVLVGGSVVRLVLSRLRVLVCVFVECGLVVLDRIMLVMWWV